LLKIGDFSRLGQVSVRTLHHYDQRGLLKPAEIDDGSGYRFYSVDQLPHLNRILALKDLGFSLDQIGHLVEGDVPAERLRGMLTLKQAEIERQLTEGRTRLARVEARLRQIEHEGVPSSYEVTLKRIAPRMVASARAVVPKVAEMPAYRCELYERLYSWLERNGVRPSGPELAVYHNDGYVEEDVDMEAAVPVDCGSTSPGDAHDDDGVGVRVLPATPAMASAVLEGDLWDIPRAVAALFAWVGESGHSSAGPMREVHHFGRELDHEDFGPGSLVIEMQIPVARVPA
jgi:DNA-binding transcriptional MerR regulator